MVDPTPALHDWAVPHDDVALRTSKGWVRKAKGKAYQGNYLTSRRKGARLSMHITDARSVVLVVAKGKKHGTVVVKLDGKKIKKLRLRAAKSRWGIVVPIATFATATSGKITVTTRSGKPVKIDGIGVR